MKMIFERRSIDIGGLNGRKVISSKADAIGNIFAFLADATLVYVSTKLNEITPITDLNAYGFPLSSLFEIHCSKDCKFVALTCTYRGDDQLRPVSRCVVIALDNSREIMHLSNGDYHTELTPFPFCFVTKDGKNLIIHATNWNRLDITDLETGQLLTERDYAEKPDLSDHEDFVFTEWPGKLLPSPGQERVATIGWVWHPIGHAYSFDLKRWLEGNKWEPDASIHQKSYAIWDYFWDSPFVWLDERRLCIWGVDENSMEPTDSATIFDAETAEQLFSFNGPTQDIFFYDEYLFSGIKCLDEYQKGLSVWDINTGELVHTQLEFAFDGYSHAKREFYLLGADDVLTLIRWRTADEQDNACGNCDQESS
jgi:hypothetical protein